MGRLFLFSVIHVCKCISNFLLRPPSLSTQLYNYHTHPLFLFLLNTIKNDPSWCCWLQTSLWPKQNCNSLQEQDGSALSLLAKAGILMTLNKQGRQSHCLRTPDLSPSLFLLKWVKPKLWQQLKHGTKGFKWLFFTCNSLWLGKKRRVFIESFSWDSVRSLSLGMVQKQGPQQALISPNLYLSPYKDMKNKGMHVGGMV